MQLLLIIVPLLFWLLTFTDLTFSKENFISTTPEDAPFIAVIINANNLVSYVGALISKKYVIASINPEEKHHNLKVHLGYSLNPKYAENYHYAKGCQIIKIRNIHWHEDDGLLKNSHHNNRKILLYDVALIELDKPARITHTVRSIQLPPHRYYSTINNSSYELLNLSTFDLDSIDGTPQYAFVPGTKKEKCLLFFGKDFLENEEFCIKSPSNNKASSVIVFNNHLIGLRKLIKPECKVTSLSCANYYYVYNKVGNFLNWIYEITDLVHPKMFSKTFKSQ